MLLSQNFYPIAAIATTPVGATTLYPLCASTQIPLWIPTAIAPHLSHLTSQTLIKTYSTPLKEHLASLWTTHQSFVFCLAMGAVVRLIAPLLRDKAFDPAVVVVDGPGTHVISVCGGHQGGADLLTRAIALQLGATPVVTGGANDLGLPGIDMLGVPFGWTRGPGDWTGVSAAIARQEPVQVLQDSGSTLWQLHLPPAHTFQFGAVPSPGSVSEMIKAPSARVRITCLHHPTVASATASATASAIPSAIPEVQWHPRVLWVGIGCERGTPQTLIETAIHEVFNAHSLVEGAIAGIATIDLKSDEAGLVEVCRDRQIPLRCFPAEILRTISVPNPSIVVDAEVGTPSVAEAAAIFAAANSTPHLRVSKQIIRIDGLAGAVTIAVAQAEQEYTGRSGQLWLVGTGPGQLDQITPAAQTAIAQADVVIGYSLYIDLIRPLLRPGQIVEALPITQERQRAQRAIALATWGLTVAVVSSGDCGIYGMAGLVLEELRAQEWDGTTPAVQVFPGITALQSAAACVGAPLMHDFCAISLSDLLTPWQVIEQRLTAAAQADFVTALYNPRSQSRIEQIAIAQRIFLTYRDPQTPVALVQSAYRQDEHITLTTLATLLDAPIDMLTTVLIGNQSTRIYNGWMITPRGYLGFKEREIRGKERDRGVEK